MGKLILISLVLGLVLFVVLGLGFALGATMIEPENSCADQPGAATGALVPGVVRDG